VLTRPEPHWSAAQGDPWPGESYSDVIIRVAKGEGEGVRCPFFLFARPVASGASRNRHVGI
jgi:hypothetical protein